MMSVLEIGRLEDAARYVVRSAILMRTGEPSPESVAYAAALAREMASEGALTPPLGFVYDLAAIATGQDKMPSDDDVAVEKPLFRRYDDYVLGRLYGDATLQRGGFALADYDGREKVRALAYTLERVVDRASLPGALLNPAVFKMLQEPGRMESLLQREWEALLREGVPDEVMEQLQLLCDRMRVAGTLLGVEDVFELEHHLALRPLSERVALRQALQASDAFRSALPKDRPPMRRAGRQVATRIEDEDLYPVGGYASLSNRGSMESLLHSQLAYMEEDDSFDLFDLKFVRDELLYFARDENTFYRRRKTMLIRLDASLESARVKEVALRWQTMTVACGLVLACFEALDQWLSDHALQWMFAFPTGDELALQEELELLQVALTEPVLQQRVAFGRLSDEQLAQFVQSTRKRSELHYVELLVGEFPQPASWCDGVDTSAAIAVAAAPTLLLDEELVALDAEPEHAWRELAEALIRSWL